MIEYLIEFNGINSLALAILLAIILIGQAIIIFFPKDAYMVYMGILFGTIGGGMINLIGLFFASWLGYELGSSNLFQRINQNQRFDKYRVWIQENGMKALLFCRLLPIIQYNIVSLTSGSMKMDKRKYLQINFFAALPYAFFWAYVGSSSTEYILKMLS
jgi:uncharacterized membrane protein YdjX (TVP38/TMEM64 family)